MADKKIVFVGFAIEDVTIRDFLKGQSLLDTSPFEYIDLSVKEAYETDWKEKVRTRIKRAHGAIFLVSKNSVTSSGEIWEVACAKEENKKILAMWAYRDDRTVPTFLKDVGVKEWNWDTIKAFINKL